MGEPIRLWKGKEEITVNGVAEANALVAKGWQVGPRPADVEPVKAADVLAAADPAPEPEPKPTPKRAGEYGSGPGTRTNKVDKTKQAEVKQERSKDKKDGVL
jgi:hypothetical protein